MIEKKVIRTVTFLLSLCLAYGSDLTHGKDFMDQNVSSGYWERIASDVANQVYDYASNNKGLQLKPVTIELKTDCPVGESFGKTLEDQLKNRGMIVSQQHQNPLILSCHISVLKTNTADDRSMSLNYTQLDDGLSVSRHTTGWKIEDYVFRGIYPPDQTAIISTNADDGSFQTDVSVSTTLFDNDQTFMDKTDIYHVQNVGRSLKIALPSPNERPLQTKSVIKKGRTFHVVE